MEYGIKRVIATVRVVTAFKRIYQGEPITINAISAEVKLSTSYLEQIFAKLRASGIVISQRGPGGGYVLAHPDEDISVATVIRAVTNIPEDSDFQPVLETLEEVSVTRLAARQQKHLAA